MYINPASQGGPAPWPASQRARAGQPASQPARSLRARVAPAPGALGVTITLGLDPHVRTCVSRALWLGKEAMGQGEASQWWWPASQAASQPPPPRGLLKSALFYVRVGFSSFIATNPTSRASRCQRGPRASRNHLYEDSILGHFHLITFLVLLKCRIRELVWGICGLVCMIVC